MTTTLTRMTAFSVGQALPTSNLEICSQSRATHARSRGHSQVPPCSSTRDARRGRVPKDSPHTKMPRALPRRAPFKTNGISETRLRTYARSTPSSGRARRLFHWRRGLLPSGSRRAHPAAPRSRHERRRGRPRPSKTRSSARRASTRPPLGPGRSSRARRPRRPGAPGRPHQTATRRALVGQRT